MDILCIILFLATFSFWFFSDEYSLLFGVYGATCVLRRRSMIAIVFVIMLAALWLSGTGAVADSLCVNLPLADISCEDVILMLLASCLPLAILKFFSAKGSMT